MVSYKYYAGPSTTATAIVLVTVKDNPEIYMAIVERAHREKGGAIRGRKQILKKD